MTTKQIVILVGPPGSGKTTYAENIMNLAWGQGLKTSRISQDDQGKQGHMDLFESALRNEIDLIIVDRMGFDKNQRNRYLGPAKKAGYKSKIVVLHVPHEVCYKRAMERKNHPTINGLSVLEKAVGDGPVELVCVTIPGVNPTENTKKLIADMEAEQSRIAKSALGTFFKHYQRVTDDEADEVLRLGWENASGSAVVIDIDGTIANIEHRRGYVQRTDGKKKDWKAFFDDMVFDVPNFWCVELVNAMYRDDRRTIVFASGRPDNYRKMTEEWLFNALEGRKWRELFMRRRDDPRPDNIVKEIILEFELKPRFKNMFMIDDRKQVVEMWRSHGYTVLQCDEGNF